MEHIQVSKVNEIFIRISANEGVLREIQEQFTYFNPKAKYDQRFKMKLWDGKIRLFKWVSKTLYYGLLDDLVMFAKDSGYQIIIDEAIRNDNIAKYTDEEIASWVGNLNVADANGKSITPFSYQVEGYKHAMTRNRCVLQSPTASGKSLMIYMLARKFLEKNYKILLVVPRKDLVVQLFKDFEDYSQLNSFDVKNHFQMLYSGLDKNFSKDVLITTWQSVYKNEPEFFEQFDAIIGDEAHLFTAKSLIKIMELLGNAKHRIGTTGTSDTDSGNDDKIKVNKFTLEGLFGKTEVLATPAELIESGHLSNIQLHCVMLKHDAIAREYISALPQKEKWRKEIEYLITNDTRNNFVTNVALQLTGNTLLMYRFVSHGKILYDTIKSKSPDREVFLISGKTPADKREEIRQYAIKNKNVIIVASYGTFSTGINIPSIENIVFAHPIKSAVNLQQTIGRGLRRADNKWGCNVIDIGDNLKKGSKTNTTFTHALERYKIYKKEKFNFKYTEVDI